MDDVLIRLGGNPTRLSHMFLSGFTSAAFAKAFVRSPLYARRWLQF